MYKYSVPALTFKEILLSDIQAVAISAPAELHYKLAHQALEAGKSVYVEKPLAMVAQEAEKLCKLADQKINVNDWSFVQYHPAFLKLKEMVLP